VYFSGFLLNSSNCSLESVEFSDLTWDKNIGSSSKLTAEICASRPSKFGSKTGCDPHWRSQKRDQFPDNFGLESEKHIIEAMGGSGLHVLGCIEGTSWTADEPPPTTATVFPVRSYVESHFALCISFPLN
jgi:hypothetical protein